MESRYLYSLLTLQSSDPLKFLKAELIPTLNSLLKVKIN